MDGIISLHTKAAGKLSSYKELLISIFPPEKRFENISGVRETSNKSRQKEIQNNPQNEMRQTNLFLEGKFHFQHTHQNKFEYPKKEKRKNIINSEFLHTIVFSEKNHPS